MNKKILYIVLLVIVIVLVGGFFIFLSTSKSNQADANATNTLGSRSETTYTENEVKANENSTSKEIKTTVTTLDDGTLYSLSEDTVKADIVIGDNYFDTQMTDLMTNYNNYKGKTVEVEGMYLAGEPYTFVGRYSNSNLCAYCPQGYSYIEFIWDGDTIKLTDTDSWIKVVGALKKGNDATSGFQDYFYLQADSIEVMNERGNDTVNN